MRLRKHARDCINSNSSGHDVDQGFKFVHILLMFGQLHVVAWHVREGRHACRPRSSSFSGSRKWCPPSSSPSGSSGLGSSARQAGFTASAAAAVLYQCTPSTLKPTTGFAPALQRRVNAVSSAQQARALAAWQEGDAPSDRNSFQGTSHERLLRRMLRCSGGGASRRGEAYDVSALGGTGT